MARDAWWVAVTCWRDVATRESLETMMKGGSVSASIAFVVALATACGSDPAQPSTATEAETPMGPGSADDHAGSSTSSGPTPATSDESGGPADGPDASSGGNDTTTGDPVPEIFVPTLVDRRLLCKLVSDTALEDPTDNALQTRFNLTGTDLGVPVVHGDALYLLFGDTVGYRVIWDFGEDPDSVARIPLDVALADPTEVCRSLDFAVTPDVPSVAAGADPAIERDFAGAWMSPPAGEPIDAYVADPAGPFPNMPGTFEVPAGALSVNGALYLFYAGRVEFRPRTRATRGFLARWDAPEALLPAYQIVRPIDDLSGGALGGHFVQIAAVALGDHVWMFGTGDYRRSPVSLARIPMDALETGVGTEVWDAASATWLDAAGAGPDALTDAAPLFETEGVGELSVQWIEDAGVLVAMYQRELHDVAGNIVDNRILLRTAPDPTGPWSEPVTVIDMADPEFTSAHCCGSACPGEQILHCDLAGLYGAYVLPLVAVTPAQGGGLELDIPFLASTWNPYNVVLFGARIRLDPV